MIYVAMGDSGAEEMRLWFDRTVAAQIDYPRAWSEMRWGLRPRWHGSLEALLALGISAIETRRFDTDVPRKFFDVVEDLESELEVRPGQHIYARKDIWPQLKRMYEGYIAEPSQSSYHPGWRASYAVVAFLAGKYDVSRTQLEALNWTVPPQRLTGWGADLSLMPLEVAARTSPIAIKVAQAELQRQRGFVRDSLAVYKQQASATNLDERALQFVRCRIASLEMEDRLQTGEWVDFVPSHEGDLNWVSSRGKHRRLPDGALEAEADPGGHMLVCRSRVGSEFEVKGEFEVVRSSTKDFQAGLVMGMPEFESSNWYGFRMKRNTVEGQIATFAIGWSRQQGFWPVSLNGDRNSFRFLFRNGTASAWVNGTEVIKQTRAPRKISVASNEYLLGLGAFNDMNQTVIRYRNIQVRRLSR